MDVTAVEGAVAVAHGGHGRPCRVVSGRPSPGGVVVAVAVPHVGRGSRSARGLPWKVENGARTEER